MYWVANQCSADEILLDRKGLCLTQDEDVEEIEEIERKQWDIANSGDSVSETENWDDEDWLNEEGEEKPEEEDGWEEDD
jgi:hypothetical protein